MENNTIEEAKKFIDELKAKGNYCLNYESVSEMLYRYADSRVKKLNKPVVKRSKLPKKKGKNGESFFQSWDKVIKNIKL